MAKNKANDRFENNEDRVRRNEQIKIPQVMVIHNGVNLGVMSNRDALKLARDNFLDLVEVSPKSKPPVCHIIDYGKFMFDRQKKNKEIASKQSQVKEKEVAFRYVISDNDLNTKANQIRAFILKGYKVKCVCKFKSREKAHKTQGFEILNKVVEILQDVADVEISPRFEGTTIMCRLEKKSPDKKKNKDKKSAENERLENK